MGEPVRQETRTTSARQEPITLRFNTVFDDGATEVAITGQVHLYFMPHCVYAFYRFVLFKTRNNRVSKTPT